MEQTFKTTTLTREELVGLHQEIGYVTEQGTYPGLLTEEINEVTKYWLRRLNTFLAKETKSLEKERIELCDKFGTISEDKTKYDFGDNIDKFKEEYDIIKNIDVPIKHAIFKLEDFTFTSKRNYSIIDKLKEEPSMDESSTVEDKPIDKPTSKVKK